MIGMVTGGFGKPISFIEFSFGISSLRQSTAFLAHYKIVITYRLDLFNWNSKN